MKKSRKEDEIRDVFFETYEKVKQATLTTRPLSNSKKAKKHQSSLTDTTRPQTAKWIINKLILFTKHTFF